MDKHIRKIMISAVILLVVLICAARLYDKYSDAYPEIQELNDNIDLPFEFGALFADCDIYYLEEFDASRDTDRAAYFSEDGNRYYFEGFPDRSDEMKFIMLYTSNVEVFGIYPSMPSRTAFQIMETYGYRCIKNSKSDAEYKKGKVRITFNLNTSNDQVIGYSIELVNTDKNRIPFVNY